jgi:N-methylhydantoinase A
VDVGGTFTDVDLVETQSGAQYRAKVPSTRADQSSGVLDGIVKACSLAGIQPPAVETLMHGTTVATNALLEGRGAGVGLITSRGFRDVLHVARSRTPGPLAGWITMQRPELPAPLERTVEIHGRLDARGAVVADLDEPALRQQVQHLLDDRGIDALCVSLLHAYANPSHERRVREVIAEVAPSIPVTLSSDVLPELGEYERTLTAAINAWLGPEVSRYLDGLQTRLTAANVPAPVHLLRSDGGLMALAQARDKAAHILLSGPAGGVVGAVAIARQAGVDRILTCDVGGTSTDVALCQGGAPEITRQTAVGAYTVRVPSVDVHRVGAGGGSIAFVPPLTGALRVGPRSAGAEPGPACYSRGGTEATLTDANVVLGYLPPRLLDGEIELDVDAARRAVQSIADALGVDLLPAAAGIVQIANENMLGALRLVSVQRGHDPRDFALMAFGGAGPLHANALGRLLGASTVLIPRGPGLLCALGDLVAGFRNEFAQTLIRLTAETSDDELREILGGLEARAREWMAAQGIPAEAQNVEFVADMRYHGQGYEIPVPWASGLDERFNDLHEQLYGFRMPNTASEIVNLRAVGTGDRPQPELPEEDPVEAMLEPGTHTRSELHPGAIVPGPSIITEFDSTTVVLDGYVAEVDRYFNILIRKGS